MAMRSLVLLACLAGIAPRLSAVDPVNVKDLSEMVANSHGKPDGRVAKQMYGLRLSERLSSMRLVDLESRLPGEESRTALLALADASAFLDLPDAEIPATHPPDPGAQKELLAKSVDYMKKQIPLWPDFMATQNVIQFSDVPGKASKKLGNHPFDEKLHVVYRSSATVRFLGGKEEIADETKRGSETGPTRERLSVQGVFGPVLSVVLKDVLISHPSWSHWEPLSWATMAVFRYQVPVGSSHYEVQNSQAQGLLSPATAYHGEIGLDPATGAILRLTLIAELPPNKPVARADILIEYGPQTLGAKRYICPVKSVAVSLARDMNLLEELYTYPERALPPFKLELNDTAYSAYHLFHSEMHVLP